MAIFEAPPIVRLAILLCLSGFSALIYQTLWLRLLGLVFGVTVYAASTVLAAFMAGLALGSFVAGRLADRVRSPIRWFGAAELLSRPQPCRRRCCSMRSKRCTGPCTRRPRSTRPADGDSIRLLVRRAVDPNHADGGDDAAGAACGRCARLGDGRPGGGALCGEHRRRAVRRAGDRLLLRRPLGIASSLRIAAICNVAVGISALFWNLPARGSTLEAAARAAQLVHASTTRARRVVLGVFAVSGFTSLALEIIWFRALVMFLPATTYAFTMILAVVLGGIAGGSAIVDDLAAARSRLDPPARRD